MKVKSMDSVELQINQIHNIESIKFCDLSIVGSSKDEDTEAYERIHDVGGHLFIPCLIVIYDNNNIIGLSSLDKHFDKLVKKIKEVYLEEKDRPIPGHEFIKYISIDDYSKKILESDSSIKTSDLYSFYKDKTGYDLPLISKQKEVIGFLPLIEHILSTNLEIIYGTDTKKFKSNNLIKGYGPKGDYILFGSIGYKTVTLPMLVEKTDDNTLSIIIANALGELKPLTINIFFNKGSLDISSISEDNNYEYIESYTYNNGELSKIEEIYSDDRIIFYKPTKYQGSDVAPNISKIDAPIKPKKSPDASLENEVDMTLETENEKLKWFDLPWGAKIGFSNDEEIVDDFTKVTIKKVQYIGINQDVFVNLTSAEKRLSRLNKDYSHAQDITIEDVDKTMVGFREGDITYISTTFGDSGVLGEYNSYYAGKHFYHVTGESDFEKINNSNIHSVGYECDVAEREFIIDNIKVIKKVRGE